MQSEDGRAPAGCLRPAEFFHAAADAHGYFYSENRVPTRIILSRLSVARQTLYVHFLQNRA